ncbi:MAG: DUF5662 family protein [Lachnospiraceae bacterium]|nr:DUF5662 family protein [Lachnospiraceae bacterium]
MQDKKTRGNSGNGHITLKKFFGHLSTILHHKKLVRKACFQAGLYKQGLCHDLSKFSPTEFWVGVRYFQGDRSPNNAEREEKGYSSAWLHHKGRNKHHMEYWIDYSLTPGHKLEGMRMPEKYVVEMFCDRLSACKTYQKEKYTDESALAYFERGMGHYTLHPESEKLIRSLLTMVKEEGEEKTFDYIRREVLHNKK